MTLRHLQDREIQEYMDGNISRENLWISIHLENCDYCKEQLSLYKKLYLGLKQDIKISLSATFSNSVITKIQIESLHASKFRISTTFLAIFGLIIGMVSTYYFTGSQRLMSFWNTFSESQKYFNFEWITQISNFIAGLNLDLSLLGFAILIVLAISTIDHFIMRSKNKLASLFR